MPISPVPHDDSPAQFRKIVHGDRLCYAQSHVNVLRGGWWCFVQHGFQLVEQLGATGFNTPDVVP
jgi:hypothetical protein